jgi:hypothetical protein
MKRKEPASPTVTSDDDPDSESPNKKKKKHNDFNGWWKLDLETSDTMVSQNKSNKLNNTQQNLPSSGSRPCCTTTTTDTTNGASCPPNPLTHQLPGLLLLLSLSSFAGILLP